MSSPSCRVYPYQVGSASIILIQIFAVHEAVRLCLVLPPLYPFNCRHTAGYLLASQPKSTPYRYTMSQSPLPTTSSSNFDAIFKTAFKAYKKQTGYDITSHPLAAWLKTCDTPDAILAVLKAQVEEFEQSRRDDERLTKWLNPTVNVLYACSATLGEGAGLVSIGECLVPRFVLSPLFYRCSRPPK
ncbi:hypothetical protein H4582DRAFT_1120108 [Lactarius indigo]|nr:hypothetical protein H4582DRAFT_509011 [Lactarius indigo]KAI9432161.1 hypothetical protein H4582DRAFT_1120108 [Lactarius indigo]